MRDDIQKLAEISAKPERLVIGLMSGTSMDGLDVALCRLRGHGRRTAINVEAFETCAYAPSYREKVAEIFSREEIDFCSLTVLNPWIAEIHAAMVLQCLEDWKVAPHQVDLIASHGQTVYHAPKSLHQRADVGNGTLQIGDGDHMAVRTGIITLHDFRQKHIAAGGEGAPLAAYGDLLIFSSPEEDRILLNIGGIANLTYLPAAGAAFSSDVGPGNTMMDALAQQDFGKPYDEGGAIAAEGHVQESLLQALLSHDFFGASLPKTTGPELFNLTFLERAMAVAGGGVSAADQMATLAAFSATAIVQAIKAADPGGAAKVFASGGGAHNPVLRRLIEQGIGTPIKDTAVLGIHPDAKEAVLMALLANECVCGDALPSGQVAGMPSVTLGKISLPG